MKSLSWICGLALALATACFAASDTPLNELSATEKADGWKLLFDGRSFAGWRLFGKQAPPDQGWVIEDGTLHKLSKVHGGDIITTNQFLDYDLRWEWKISPKCNNGVKYLVSESRKAPGPEYQMIDEKLEPSPEKAKFSTAALYEIFPPAPDKQVNPPGQWNSSRILVQGKHVEHWLNGKKVLEYELESPELKEGISQSKFKDIADFGNKIKGHILLTDHHDEAWFRNIKIRELPAK